MVAKVEEELDNKDRISQLRDKLLQTQPRLSTERLRLYRESYKETEGESPAIRRAKAFEKLLNEMTIFIEENPIVGTLTKYTNGMQPYPEVSCDFMAKEVEYATGLGVSEKINEEEKRDLFEAAHYWKDRCVIGAARNIWAEKYPGRISPEELYNNAIRYVITHPIKAGRLCADYGKVLNKGLSELIREAEQELDKLSAISVDGQEKRDYLKAVIISLKAAISFARRYAALAREMAEQETDAGRKRELERIAETCTWIPENPARTFYEAIQSVWFIHLLTQMEGVVGGHTLGRFPNYMYPFYKKDKDAGNITTEEAIELIELFFLNLTGIVKFYGWEAHKGSSGNLFQNVALGGVTPDGEDATTELDYLILEAQKRLRSFQPTLSVLYHDKLPPDFMFKAVEVVRTGIGMPAFFNNDVLIQRHLDHGASLADARNSCIIGCVESGFSHTASSMDGFSVNMAKALELALNNGEDPLTGKQIGPETGEAESFDSYEELFEAVRKQIKYLLDIVREFSLIGDSHYTRFFPIPFISALVDDCIKKGKDVNNGGARYSMNGCNPIGTIDLTDSLAAIKQLVFEEKSVTMKELKEALRANFEGYEELRHKCLECSKYGNDNDYVDEIGKELYSIFWEMSVDTPDELGRPMRPSALSISQHWPLGEKVGALPSGRKAGLALCDGSVSASPGMDRKGPTALVRSATRVIDCTKYASNLFNLKFHPSALDSKEGLNKLIALIKTYMDFGGHQIQFNVVSSDTLKDAQDHPEKYRDLVVRVAGFSAFFIHLDPVIRNEIIKRSELKFEA
ncbi:glycyl radical protein [Candidatus Omnitrophota bacterium]